MQLAPAPVVRALAIVTAQAAAASLPPAEQAVAPAHAIAGAADFSDDEMPQFDILGCIQQDEAAQAVQQQQQQQPAYAAVAHVGAACSTEAYGILDKGGSSPLQQQQQQQHHQQTLWGQPEKAPAAPATCAAPRVTQQPPPQQQPAPAEDDGWGSPMLPASLYTVAAPMTGTGNAASPQPTTRSRSTGRQRRMQPIFDDELAEPSQTEQQQQSRMNETLAAEPPANLGDSGSDPDLHWSKPRLHRPAVAAGVAAANAAFAVRGLKRLRRVGNAGGSSGAARILQPMQSQQQQQEQVEQPPQQEQYRGGSELSPERPRPVQRDVLALAASRPAPAEQEQPARKPRGNPFARLGATASVRVHAALLMPLSAKNLVVGHLPLPLCSESCWQPTSPCQARALAV